MKAIKTIVLSSILFCSIGFSQTKNQVSLSTGVYLQKAEFFNQPVGGTYYNFEKQNNLQLNYLRNFSKHWSFETGLHYLKGKIIAEGAYLGPNFPKPKESKEDFSMITIPVFANYTFAKYFFVNAGPLFSFQTTKNSFDSISGVGLGAGVGAFYNYNNFILSLTPQAKLDNLLDFNRSKEAFAITEFTVQFGVGYRF